MSHKIAGLFIMVFVQCFLSGIIDGFYRSYSFCVDSVPQGPFFEHVRFRKVPDTVQQAKGVPIAHRDSTSDDDVFNTKRENVFFWLESPEPFRIG